MLCMNVDAVVMVKIRKGSSCILLKTLKTVFHGIFALKSILLTQ